MLPRQSRRRNSWAKKRDGNCLSWWSWLMTWHAMSHRKATETPLLWWKRLKIAATQVNIWYFYSCFTFGKPIFWRVDNGQTHSTRIVFDLFLLDLSIHTQWKLIVTFNGINVKNRIKGMLLKAAIEFACIKITIKRMLSAHDNLHLVWNISMQQR